MLGGGHQEANGLGGEYSSRWACFLHAHLNPCLGGGWREFLEEEVLRRKQVPGRGIVGKRLQHHRATGREQTWRPHACHSLRAEDAGVRNHGSFCGEVRPVLWVSDLWPPKGESYLGEGDLSSVWPLTTVEP